MKKINITIQLDPKEIEKIWPTKYDENDLVQMVKSALNELRHRCERNKDYRKEDRDLSGVSRLAFASRDHARIKLLELMIDSVTSENYSKKLEAKIRAENANDVLFWDTHGRDGRKLQKHRQSRNLAERHRPDRARWWRGE
jgi:hypothetical protein